MKKPFNFPKFAALSLAFVLSSCGGGGGSDSSSVSTNACSVLGLNTKIINGTQCGESPSAAVVRVITLSQDRKTSGLCTGTALSSSTVLTAAHCFSEPTSLVVVEINNVDYRVSKISVHPNYKAGRLSDGELAGFNDVAILHVNLPAAVATLPLLESRPVKSGDVMSIFGFGLDAANNAGVFRSGQTEVSRVFETHILSEFSGKGSNTCKGDSGGPAVITENGRPALVGVTSTGSATECGGDDLSLYVNLQDSEVLNFISQEVPNVQVL